MANTFVISNNPYAPFGGAAHVLPRFYAEAKINDLKAFYHRVIRAIAIVFAAAVITVVAGYEANKTVMWVIAIVDFFLVVPIGSALFDDLSVGLDIKQKSLIDCLKFFTAVETGEVPVGNSNVGSLSDYIGATKRIKPEYGADDEACSLQDEINAIIKKLIDRIYYRNSITGRFENRYGDNGAKERLSAIFRAKNAGILPGHISLAMPYDKIVVDRFGNTSIDCSDEPAGHAPSVRISSEEV